MKTLNELRAFCEGYRLKAFYADGIETMCNTDDWVVWGGYDINFAGYEYSGHAKSHVDLHCDAYKAGWTDSIGEPVHSFTIFGESK